MNTQFLDIMICKALKVYDDGQLPVALKLFEELTALAPAEPRLQYHQGMICMELHDNQAACTHFRELVRLQPDFLEGRMLLGMIYAELGLQEEAIDTLRGVLEVCPNVPEIHHRLGLSLAGVHRYEDAYREYQEVLRLIPDHSAVLCSLGVLFTTMGKIEEARKILLRAIELKPDSVNVINNLGRICKIGKASEGLHWFQRGLDLEPENESLTSNYLYTLNYVPDLLPEFIAGKYKEYAPRCYRPRSQWRRPDRIVDGKRPLRVGYLSSDLYGHSVSFFLEPVLQHHDRSKFEVFCYYNRTLTDKTTERLKKLCSGWHCIYGISDEMVADIIAADRIDILVDLSGHTAGHRLGVFTLHPAPVQVSWIGHPNTTGLPQMDYYLTDELCDPPGMTDHLFSEQLYRLPRIFSCYLPPEDFPPVSPLPSSYTGTITLGCFNNIAKVNDQLISWWAAILNEIPGAKLYIKSPALDDESVRQDMLSCLGGFNIQPERLLLQGVTGSREDHLGKYAMVDIALDTFPYHGTTTTCEALWMGVPVVTLAGRTHASRVGVSLLHAVGLDELVAITPVEYIAKTVALANDRERLVELRQNMRLMMSGSPLMDSQGVTREVERAFMDMYAETMERNCL